MPKTLEDLRQSREQREKLIQMLGCIPESIMTYDGSDKAMDLMAEERSYDSCSIATPDQLHLSESFEISGQSVRAGALSRFPQNVGKVMVKFYSNPNDIILDPFAGHNSRMELCIKCGRQYYGTDISKKFMEANFKVLEKIQRSNSESLFPITLPDVKLHLCDSRHLPWKDETGDFTITSPPYWDIEYYGDEPEQLGKGTYEQFLEKLRTVAKENFRCLKHGAYCIWAVNDFRKDRKYYNYHGNTIDILESVGFIQQDMLIVDLGMSFRAAFFNQAFLYKQLPKRHEYWIVMYKK